MISVRTLFAAAILMVAAAPASAQPGFFPGDWLAGRSGLFNRHFIVPPDDVMETASTGGWLTGGRKGKLVFAAATVDSYCQQEQVPDIDIIERPRTGRVSVNLGGFRSTGVAGGSTYCLGRAVRGVRVFYSGSARAGERIVLRVRYPAYGATSYRGFVQDYVIPVGR